MRPRASTAGSAIAGNVYIFDTRRAADPLSAGTNVVCNTTIGGDLVIGPSGFGAPWNIGLCGPNTIHGNLVFTGNQAPGNSIAGNTVDRNLACVRNRSVGTASNTVKGRVSGDCRP